MDINHNEVNTNNYFSKDINGKILVMRHGETYFNIDPDKGGKVTNSEYVDPNLTEKGINQAKSIQNT